METFIRISGDDPENVEVAYDPEYQGGAFAHVKQTVDLSPNPTWPSPTEVAEYVATAVHQVMMLAWNAATGEPVCICDKPHDATTCPDHPTCQGVHEPEPVTVRPLGHYEQMQISLALQVLRDSVNSDGSHSFGTDDLATLDIACIAEMETLFASHGTVTVTRKEG